MIKYILKHCKMCNKDYKVKPDYMTYFSDQCVMARDILRKYKPAEQIDDIEDDDICPDCASIIKKIDEETRYYFNTLIGERIRRK